MKPLVGLTPVLQADGRYAVHSDYVNAITAAGGVPVLLPLYSDALSIAQWLCRIDACLLTGGGDIDPAYYGEAPHEKTEPEPLRDSYEIPLCRALYEYDIPTLGICRGIQVMVAALGGTLYQHVEGHSGGVVHAIHLTHDMPPSLCGLPDAWEVNSYHHQAVKKIPSAAQGIAYTVDGNLCEGVWFSRRAFFVGVQWHPERAGAQALSKSLFAGLIQTAKERREA